MSRGHLRTHQLEELDIERLAPTGDGLADAPGGIAVQVPAALPGERVLARIEHISRQAPRAIASLQQLLRSSPARREPPCPHQGRCDGCPLMILDEATQRELKRALLIDHFGLETDRMVCRSQGELGYRWSSKRVAGGVTGALILGSFRRGSHQLANMEQCLVDHPDIAECARELANAAGPLGLSPYRESDSSGLLRYVWLKTDGSGAVLVCLVLAKPDRAAALRLAERLERPAGVAWCVQASTGNVLRGDELEVLTGRHTLSIPIGDGAIEVGPLGFLQPNPQVAALAYQDLVTTVDEQSLAGRLALDLYAGAGATTRLLRKRFDQVVPCEVYPESAAALGVPPERAAPFLQRWLDDRRPAEGSTERKIDLVVANPPRAGLGSEACELLSQLRAARVHLMSCHPAALRRDLGRLTGPTGTYRLTGLRAYDTLPQTPHVEVVAWLERKCGG